MSFNQAKARAEAREMGNKLGIRFADAAAGSLTLTAGIDSTTQAPTLSIGPGTAGAQNAFVRVLENPSLGTDALGLAQQSYGPLRAQVVLETSSVANVPLLTGANSLRLWVEVLRTGMVVDLYLTANGTAPTAAGITGSPAVTVDDLRFPTVNAS